MARKYDSEVKDRVLDAVRAAVEAGQEAAIKVVAQEYDIPYHTVYYWAKDAGLIGSHITEQKNRELDDILEAKAKEALEAWSPRKDDSKNIAIAAGIFVQRLTERQTLRMQRETTQGIGAADWLAHVTITRAGKDSLDTQRPGESEHPPVADAAVPVSTTVGESNLPGSSGESR